MMNKKSETFAVKKTPFLFSESGVVLFAKSKDEAKKTFEKTIAKTSSKK